MKYFKNKLKDNELPALVFLMNQLLKFQFKTHYEKLGNKEIQAFLNEGDTPNTDKNPLTIEPVKNMFELTQFDTRYRPLYTSIEYLLALHLDERIDFKTYIQENKEHIDVYFESLDYLIQEVNPERSPVSDIASRTQTIHLGNQVKGIQINLSEGMVSNLLESVAFRVGDLLTEQVIEKPKLLRKVDNGRVYNRLMLTETIRQENIENIIAKAIEFARLFESHSQKTDSDWISEFFNICQDCSNQKMQYLWAKILANEIDKPGSFSRRALNAIKLLNSQEAKIFSLLCNCLWEIHPGETRSDRVLIKNSDNQGHYSDATWNFDGTLLRHLEDLGLVHETYIVLEKDETYNISFFGNSHQLSTKENAFEMELVRLSTVGAEIYDVVMTEKNIEYYQFTLEYLKNINVLRK